MKKPNPLIKLPHWQTKIVKGKKGLDMVLRTKTEIKEIFKRQKPKSDTYKEIEAYLADN